MLITKEFRFEAAHYLPNVPQGHQCGRMHGHTYHVVIGVEGKVGGETGWVVDYADIKSAWKPIEERFDHHVLNDYVTNPTAELLAQYVFQALAVQPVLWAIAFVTVKETESSSATYTPEAYRA